MSKESAGQLSDEFKEDIRKNGSKKNIFGTIIALLAIIIVFGTIGVAGYELIFKPEKVVQKSADEKIESRPTEEIPKTTNTAPATTTTTPATTPTPAPAFTNYTVASGDSYSSIANANGITSDVLMKYNGATSEDLQIGQVIKIPKS